MFWSILSVPPIKRLYWATRFGIGIWTCFLSAVDQRLAWVTGATLKQFDSIVTTLLSFHRTASIPDFLSRRWSNVPRCSFFNSAASLRGHCSILSPTSSVGWESWFSDDQDAVVMWRNYQHKVGMEVQLVVLSLVLSTEPPSPRSGLNESDDPW